MFYLNTLYVAVIIDDKRLNVIAGFGRMIVTGRKSKGLGKSSSSATLSTINF
jgi:hypothetical protein